VFQGRSSAECHVSTTTATSSHRFLHPQLSFPTVNQTDTMRSKCLVTIALAGSTISPVLASAEKPRPRGVGPECTLPFASTDPKQLIHGCYQEETPQIESMNHTNRFRDNDANRSEQLASSTKQTPSPASTTHTLQSPPRP
jgi:hypothetical protein